MRRREGAKWCLSTASLGGNLRIGTSFAALVRVGVIALACHASSSTAAGALNIPHQGKSLQSFVPTGYEVGEEVHSDFDGNGRKDIAALLWVSPDSTETRLFIILLQQPNGTYRLSARVDSFTMATGDSCGGGNFNCVPDISAKGKALVIRMPWGSAAGYDINESEFRLVGSGWFQVRQAQYQVGVKVSCPQGGAGRMNERCVEVGLSKNLKTGVETNYCKFADDRGRQTRLLTAKRKSNVRPLKTLSEVQWSEPA